MTIQLWCSNISHHYYGSRYGICGECFYILLQFVWLSNIERIIYEKWALLTYNCTRGRILCGGLLLPILGKSGKKNHNSFFTCLFVVHYIIITTDIWPNIFIMMIFLCHLRWINFLCNIWIYDRQFTYTAFTEFYFITRKKNCT